jgi:hypothetical protein
MSSYGHIQARAAYLAALPAADAERKLAFEHARSCSACAKALAEGERVISLIDSLPPPPPPTELALQRASEAILRELAPARDLRGRWDMVRALLSAIPIAAGWAIAVALAKHRVADRASWFWSVAIALSASVVGIVRLNAFLGVARLNAAAAGAAAVLSGIFSAMMGSAGMFSPAIGIKCVVIELIAASLPLSSTAFLVITRRVAGGPWLFSAAAALGALAGHAGLHLTCPVHTASPHLFAFHTGGVILAAMVGLAVSRIPALSASH